MDNDIKFICFIIIVILMAAVTIIALIMNIEETKAKKREKNLYRFNTCRQYL